VADGLGDEVGLGRVVVDLGTSRDSGALDDPAGGRVRVAVLDKAVDRRVEKGSLRRRSPLGLRAPCLLR
jgi:hypothetical protein